MDIIHSQGLITTRHGFEFGLAIKEYVINSKTCHTIPQRYIRHLFLRLQLVHLIEWSSGIGFA